MPCSKSWRTISSSKSFRHSKDFCPRCTRSVNVVKERASQGLLTYYKSLCKSSKCLIHGKNYQLKIKKTDSTADLEKIRPIQKLESRKVPHVKIPSFQCSVDEFEEEINSLDDIDFEMYTKIDATVEDLELCKDRFFSNAAGFKMIKEIIDRTIIWPLKKPEIFKGLRSAPKGVLLFGPPGTGKTFLGKYIASKTNSTFFKISVSTLMSKWMGDSEKLVRTMFLVAKARQPSVIFIDEIDSILSKRTSDENGSSRRMTTEFLSCMNENDASLSDRILIVGATSRPQELDEAVRSRFFKRIYISLPNSYDRKEILLKLLERECHSLEEIDISDIVTKTHGYSVTDLKNLSQEAAMGPIKALAGSAFARLKPDIIRPISLEDFLCALQLIKPTVTEEQVKSCEEWDSLYGYGGDENSLQN